MFKIKLEMSMKYKRARSLEINGMIGITVQPLQVTNKETALTEAA